MQSVSKVGENNVRLSFGINILFHQQKIKIWTVSANEVDALIDFEA